MIPIHKGEGMVGQSKSDGVKGYFDILRGHQPAMRSIINCDNSFHAVPPLNLAFIERLAGIPSEATVPRTFIQVYYDAIYTIQYTVINARSKRCIYEYEFRTDDRSDQSRNMVFSSSTSALICGAS